MAVPRNRSSTARKGSRRAHINKSPKSIRNCPNCKALVIPHCVCKACGIYNNRQVVQIEA